MSVQLLFFAQAADWAGCGKMKVTGKNNERLEDLIKRHKKLAPLLRHRRILRVAVNHEFKGFSVIVKDGDEIGFLPPVSGG